MRRQWGWWTTVVALILAVGFAAPVRAEDGAKSGTGAADEASAQAETSKAQANAQQKEGLQTVETILRQQEDLLSGKQFSYDPGGRRDPFRSLFEEQALRRKGPRPRGVAGSVTFRQQVDDPRLIKPYRDVVKRLVPQGEEKGNE